MTVYEPLVPDATVNVPDIAPPATVHNGSTIRLTGVAEPTGEEEIKQPVSPAAKFEPETRTSVPGRPEVGSNEIAGVTRNWVLPKSPRSPKTVMVYVAGGGPGGTLNEPVIEPEVIEHVPRGPTPSKKIPQKVSPRL